MTIPGFALIARSLKALGKKMILLILYLLLF
jgi:hypothetical protein